MSKPNLTQLRVQSKELLRAVRAGDPDALRRIAPYFPSADAMRLANSQLVVARENGFSSWAKLKLECGDAEPSAARRAIDRYFAAVEAGDAIEVQSILQSTPGFAAARRKGKYGWESALNVAAAGSSLETVRVLVEGGAEVYDVRQGDYPAVMNAFWAKQPEIVDYLLKASQGTEIGGAPPTYGCGIDIVLATRAGWTERVAMHIERDPLAVYRRGCIGETVLHWPAHNGYTEVVELLLDHGAQIEADEIGLYGGKPLHWAAEHAPRCVELLLRRGANPMSRNVMKGDHQGFTPLHMTASQRDECIECAELLLAAGADPEAVDAQNRTPLEVARAYARRAMSDYLAKVTKPH